MSQEDKGFSLVPASEVEVGDILDFQPLIGRLEVHAITREPSRRRALWRSRPALLTFWSDDRFRDEVLKWGQEHFLITPAAIRVTVDCGARVRRVLRHPR